jgi:hypothetical protein
MIGYMDTFSSIASPAADAFILFDNVRVEVPVLPVAPGVSSQPQNVSVYPYQDATFFVAATGTGPLSYQWRFNGTNLVGATSNSFTRAAIQAQDVGYYSVVISNTAGSISSSNALLLLLDSPYLSAIQATPGDRAALISWKSTLPAANQVQFQSADVILPSSATGGGGGSGFTQTSYLDPALTTNHVVLLTGLAPQTRYSYQVLSPLGTNTFVSGVYQFTTLSQLPAGQNPPAWWLNFFFGNTNNPNTDADHDGYTTAQEYTLGTNPTNGTSSLSLIAGCVTNTLQITFWPLLSDRSYQLLFRSNVTDLASQILPAIPSASVDGHGLFTLPLTNSVRGYYRLQVQPSTNSQPGLAPIRVSRTWSPYASDPICGPNRAYLR